MKKIRLFLVSLAALFCLSSCKKGEQIVSYDSDTNSGLVVLCIHSNKGFQITFIRDTYTDNIMIEFFERHGTAAGGSLSYYYNANGEIMKYDEFITVHKH